MQRISRAVDSVWATAAFDPRKPVDPNWASQAPAPVLRSGDEPQVLSDSPEPHDHTNDTMAWSVDPPAEEDRDDQFDGPYNEPGYNEYGVENASSPMPDHDLQAIRSHRNSIRARGNGRLEGSDPRMMVQYHNAANVSHYYNYNPSADRDKPWELTTTHWQLAEPMVSRHRDFVSAAVGAAGDKQRLRERGII